MRNNQKEAAIIFIDFKKAFDSVDRNTLFQILHACSIPEKIVKVIQIMYVNTSAVVLTPEGETSNFNINTGVLQGDSLAPYLFIIVLDYALRTAVGGREGLTLTRRRSSRHPASHLSDLDYVDDIALFADTIQEAEYLYFIKWKVLPNLLDCFSTQAKQSTSISTPLLMTAFTHQMGVKLRR